MASRKNKRFIRVTSPAEGLKEIQSKDVTENYKKALRWRPKNRRAVLIPCSQTKPYPTSPSHEHGYGPALEGKDVDVWVVSEPLGVVPYSWSDRWPQDSYEFAPKHLKGKAHDVLSGRVASWIKRVAPKYERITVALPLHHRKLWDKALRMTGGIDSKVVYAGISECRDEGACPDNHFRATSPKYRKYLRARANPRANPSWPDPSAADIRRKLENWGFRAEYINGELQWNRDCGGDLMISLQDWHWAEAWDPGSEHYLAHPEEWWTDLFRDTYGIINGSGNEMSDAFTMNDVLNGDSYPFEYVTVINATPLDPNSRAFIDAVIACFQNPSPGGKIPGTFGDTRRF